ncbi:hypothetical protein AN958_04964 [Leucoagaricus sp. SymC.cos]|nr:hypothetical protein AN958_04964 [Leucoagaricus sp. SymC.cos]
MHRSDYRDSPPPPSMNILPSTFLTPSELLVELSSQGGQARQPLHPSSMVERPRVYSSSKSSRQIVPNLSQPEATTVLDSSLLSSSLNDSSSESITSHEKKRHYLECLEHYVAFLHEHFLRNGLEPAPLERISNYRSLNSRSIRSLLIHMEKKTRRMQERILQEEHKVCNSSHIFIPPSL